MAITYRKYATLSISDFRDLIVRTQLNRDVDDEEKLRKMRDNADFLYTAWDGQKVVGYIRGLTDDADVLYIADLGIDKDYWRQGIGRQLLKMIDEGIGAHVHQVLLASELAAGYYSKVGFTKDTRGYMRQPK